MRKIKYFVLFLLFQTNIFSLETNEFETLELDHFEKPGNPFKRNHEGVLQLKCFVMENWRTKTIREIILDAKLLKDENEVWLLPGSVLKNHLDPISKKQFKLGQSFTWLNFWYSEFTKPDSEILNTECCTIL